MQKKLAILIVIPTYIYALYNPFFNDYKSEKKTQPQPKVVQKTVVKNYKQVPKKSIKMTYYGYVHSNKGEFALVRFNQKNIIIKAKDSIYHDAQTYKVRKITSNYIYLQDKKGRTEAVYFSSESYTQ